MRNVSVRLPPAGTVVDAASAPIGASPLQRLGVRRPVSAKASQKCRKSGRPAQWVTPDDAVVTKAIVPHCSASRATPGPSMKSPLTPPAVLKRLRFFLEPAVRCV